MTEEELNTQLYERMFEEQERFRAELLGKSPQEVLDSAYAYVMRKTFCSLWSITTYLRSSAGRF